MPGANNNPATVAPPNAIDNSSGTKFLNFAETGVGFIVTPPVHGPLTNVFGVRFRTGNDAPERDPLTVTLEGTTDANPTATLNSSWTQIYSGPTGLSTDPGRLAFGPDRKSVV